jgi:hypothetical protein
MMMKDLENTSEKYRANILKNEFIDLSKWLTNATEAEYEIALNAFVEGFKLYERMLDIKLDDTETDINEVRADFAKQFRDAANRYNQVDLSRANGTAMLSVLLDCMVLERFNDAVFVIESGLELKQMAVEIIDINESQSSEVNDEKNN